MWIILLMGILCPAVVMDLRKGRIDNRWILLSAAAGLLVQIRMRGPEGALYAAAGFSTAFTVLFVLFVFRMLGAGDIKLFCALGTVLGPAGILKCIAGAFIAGAAIALIRMVSARIFRERFLYLFHYIQNTLSEGKIRPYIKPGLDRPENIHFTVPIMLSAVLLSLF